ncbi:WD40 repeat-like protein [Basidiobolus meristosporus CBS 931.73]|uniref:WD40 repeat-like protein n=1 Tax=Basidiobolus meristosporus CBS 931.73 TaxID=1314790 RepID=A0A1Y1XGH0_9FUNG|nr:WD40 repeat-like protein [Basidiobolus meristosporus CBS 931.73]|eukprot:ORX84792.1 WD40 repeat-like protein [Basidiobolus meristosporus CBS 931.73]
MNFAANVSSNPDNLFQSDRELAIREYRELKMQNKIGSPIDVKSKILCLLVLDSEHLIIGQASHVARKVNIKSGKTIKIYSGHTGPVTSVALIRDHQNVLRLATGSWDKSIKIWDLESKECIRTLQEHTDFVKSLVFHPKGYLFSGSSDASIRKWSLLDYSCVKLMKGHGRGIEDMALTLDGEYLISASSDVKIKKWNVETGAEIQEFNGHLTSVYGLSITEDEIWSVSGDKTARRWSLDTGKQDTTLEHPDFVKCVTVAGSYVITGCRDENVRVFDIGSGKCLKTLEGHFDEVTGLAVIGTDVYSGSLDGTIRSWSITAKSLSEPAEKVNVAPPKLNNNSIGLTEEEERELAELMSDEDL